MPAGRADPKNRSDLEGRAAPQKQVRSRRSKKEVRSGKWGCPRKTGPGPKVRCGRWDYQNGPSFPSMSNMGGTKPQIGPPKCVSHGATTQTDLFFRERLPKRTFFSQHAQYGTSPLAILYLPIVHGQGTHNKSFWSFNSSLEKWMLAKPSILNFFTSTVLVKTIARAFKSLVRSSNLPKVHHEVGNGPQSPPNPNVNYEVWIVTSRVVNWKGEPF